VVDEGQLSVAASFPPVDGALEVVESERELPVSGTCIKVKSTGGVLRALGGQTSNPWSPPPGTVRMLRAHVQVDAKPDTSTGYPVYLDGWDGVSWREISGWNFDCDVRVDIPPGMMQLRVRSPMWSSINVPEVEVEEEVSSP